MAQLWATRRVGFLLDEIRLRGENSEVRDEVVDLARRFGIVTPYTSYLIVEDETRRQVPVAVRTLQRLGSDSEAQSYLRRNWEQMTVTKDGYNGSLAGRANDALKSASTPSEAVEKAKQQNLAGVISNNAKGEGGAGAGAVAAAPKPSIYAQPGAMRGRVGTEAGKEVADRTLSAEQNTRFINGKTFTQNGAQWNDTTLHAAQEAKRTRIQFGSPEYFALLAEKPLTSQWLALGNNVTFTLGKEIYEVYE
jgi:Ca-activated chloride channel family protein